MKNRFCGWRRWAAALVCAAVVAMAETAAAIAFPDAVDGTIAIDVASGVTNTYDAALPDVASVVKTGSGCAILATASSAFAGQVDVREGTLALTDCNAVGAKGKLAVTGDAATLHLNFAAPSGAGQRTEFFTGHDITIRGKGADGKGALRWTDPNSLYSMYDSMIDTLTLSGDAYISVTHRYGFSRALNLNGHVLTRIDGSAHWMWYHENLVVGAGVVSNVTGKITFQNTAKYADPENTTLYMAGGSIHFWNAWPIPCRVVMCGGGIEVGAGGDSGRNVFTGPVDIAKEVTVTADGAGRSVEFRGPMTHSAEMKLNGKGRILLSGSLEKVKGNENTYVRGHVVCASNAVRSFAGLVLKDEWGGAGRFDVYGGVVTNSMLRVANGGAWRGTLVQTNGLFVCTWDSYVGEGTGSYGSYLMSGGSALMNYDLNVCAAVGSEGVVWQTGGRMRMYGDGKVRLGRAGRGFMGVFNGATNDTWVYTYGGSTRLCLGDTAFGRGTLAVAGTGSVVQTESVVMGAANVVSTNLVAVTDGGTLKARRFYREEGAAAEAVNEVWVDGGVVMPTFFSGWNHVDYNRTNFFLRSPDHWTIGPRGMAVDTSELLGDIPERDASSVNFPHSLTDAAGRGIASIALPSDDEDFAAQDYRGPAFVDIEGPDGSYGAAAMAEFDPDTGGLTRVVVVSPGCNYDETTRVYVRAAGNTGRYECAYTLTDVRTGGVLVKRGAGTLHLHNANDYTGGTVVEGGVLSMRNELAFPSNTPLVVKTGGTFRNGGRPLAVSTLGGVGGTVEECGAVTVTAGLEISAAELYAASAPLTVKAEVVFAAGATAVRVGDPENLPPHRHGASVAFLRATGGFSGTIPRLDLVDETGTSWTVFRRNDELRLTPVNGTLLILR